MSTEVWVITTSIYNPMVSGPSNYHVDHPMIGPVPRMEEVYSIVSLDKEPNPDWIIFVHDDVEIIHPNYWRDAFESSIKDLPLNTAIVGLGGATGIGTPDLYKTPYHITQLIRHNYASNQTDWAVHGTHETGVKKVAVVDGFFLAIRWKFLEEIGGFSWMQTRFHCYDLALCLEAYRRNWEVWMVGLECVHHGGGTSTKKDYIDWCAAQGTTAELEHSQPHRWLADRYRDLLPFSVTL